MKQLFIVYSQENNVIAITDSNADDKLILKLVAKHYELTAPRLEEIFSTTKTHCFYKISGLELGARTYYLIKIQAHELTQDDPQEYNPGPEGNDSKTHALIMGIDWEELRKGKKELLELDDRSDDHRICEGGVNAIRNALSLLSSLQDAVVLDGLLKKEEVFGAEAGE